MNSDRPLVNEKPPRLPIHHIKAGRDLRLLKAKKDIKNMKKNMIQSIPVSEPHVITLYTKT